MNESNFVIIGIAMTLVLILLILILALIFKKDFRADMLKMKSENSAEFKGVKVTGALFWVIYAATAIGTIYLVNKLIEEGANGDAPIVKSVSSNEWMALDLNEEKPVEIAYGLDETSMIKTNQKRDKLTLDLRMDNHLKIRSAKSNYEFGEIEDQDLQSLRLTNDFSPVSPSFEIRYDLILNPFEYSKNQGRTYNWTEYEKLPFQILPKYDRNNGLHVEIISEAGQLETETYSLNDKWEIPLYFSPKIYLVALRQVDLNPNYGDTEFANFRITEFTGKILH